MQKILSNSITLFYFIIHFLFSNGLAIAQQNKIDSLKVRLTQTLHDTDRVNTLNYLFDVLWQSNSKKQALLYINDAKALSEKIGWQKGLANTYSRLGTFYDSRGDYNTALQHHFAALRIREIIKHKPSIGASLNNIGRLYLELGNYYEAHKYHLKALEIAKELGNTSKIAKSYALIANVYFKQDDYPNALTNYLTALKTYGLLENKMEMGITHLNIGNVHFRFNNYNEALKNYSMALKIAEQYDDKERISLCYGSIGICYLQQHNYTSALNSYYASLKIAEELENTSIIANNYYNIADVYSLLNNLENALKKYQQSIVLFKEIGDNNGVMMGTNNIGRIYLKQHNISQAKEFLLQSLRIAKKINSKDDISAIYESLSLCDSASGNWRGAYEYHKLYQAWSDSIINKISVEKIAEMSARYDSEKKDQELLLKDKNIELLEKDKQVKNYFLIGLLIVLVMTSVIVALWFKNHKQKQKEVALKNIALEQKLLRLQMNPHFIFNSLSSISAEMSENIPKARDYLAKFARLMRLVLENSREPYVGMKSEVDTLNYYLLLQQQQFNDTFDFEISIDPDIAIDTIEIPPMLIQPHIENAILHGVNPGDKKGMIHVHFQKESENIIRCDIQDNGVGRKKSREKETTDTDHKSLALEITKERLKTLAEDSKLDLDFKIKDLEDGYHNPLGTLVSLMLPYR